MTPYNPRANGKIERVHRPLKSAFEGLLQEESALVEGGGPKLSIRYECDAVEGPGGGGGV